MSAHFSTDIVDRIRAASTIVEGLEPTIRLEAFRMLLGRADAGPPRVKDRAPSHNYAKEQNGASVGEFFVDRKAATPAESALLIAAYLYDQYGVESFSLEDVRGIATEVGLTIPDRIDMTYSAAKRDGRALFQRAGKGHFRPTVNGELYLQRTYNVSKGTTPKPSATSLDE